MSRENKLGLCKWLLVANLCFIWGNSLMSAEASLAFSDWVKQLLGMISGTGAVGGGSGLLRKIAHFTEFTSLGLCLGWLFLLKEKPGHWALVWGASAACLDETIQCFVPGRGPGLRDVAIDVLGVCTGMVLLQLARRIQGKRKTNNL